jgi:hypothetical protein
MAWSMMSISSCRGGEVQLEVNGATVMSWARTISSDTEGKRVWQSYQEMEGVKATTVAKLASSRCPSSLVIAHPSGACGRWLRLEGVPDDLAPE